MINVKEIYVNFENCEAIRIGAKNIKNLAYNDNEIILEVIENGDSDYITTYGDNKVSPLERLTVLKDITSIEVVNESEKIELNPEWYSESEWYTPQENKYQINEIIDYKNRKIVISKQEYIKNRMNELSDIITEARDEYKALFKDLADILNNK